MDNVEFISTVEIDTPLPVQSSTPNPPFNNPSFGDINNSRLSHHTEIPRLSRLNDTSRLSHNNISRMSHHNDTSRISLNESTRLSHRDNSGEQAYREAFPLNEEVIAQLKKF